jgi:hypothetical protein
MDPNKSEKNKKKNGKETKIPERDLLQVVMSV